VACGAAAAWRSCAIPENSAPSVAAASGGASMSRPPLAVRRTVTPATRRWSVAAAADGSGSAAIARSPELKERQGQVENSPGSCEFR